MKTNKVKTITEEQPGDNSDQQDVDKAPGEERATKEKQKSPDVKGEKVEAGPSNQPGNAKSELIFPEKYLRVKGSVLPGAGKGLFTTKPIPKGTRIAEYKGRITSWKEVDHKEGTNPYIFYVRRNHVIDARPYKKVKARFANDARGLKKITGLVNNATYVEDGRRVFIEAKRDIPAGSEILVDYGREYWDIMKHNSKLSGKNE